MTPMTPRIDIEHRTGCRWLPRAGWTAQELPTSFEGEPGEVALAPGSGGVFEVRLDGETPWSRKAMSRFPALKELKQLARGRIAPDKPLGHSDRPAGA